MEVHDEPEDSQSLDLGFDDSLVRPDSLAPDGRAFRGRVLARLEQREGASSRYRIGRRIGHGGMGTVFEVWDEDLRRRLAMKVIRADRASNAGVTEHQLARFVEEAQISGQLEHPGIVPVHELGIDSEGRVYFTMKLVKGQTLREVFKRNRAGDQRWSNVRIVGVLLRACEALAFAHDKGVIHRDLKPSNVMVGDFGEVYVLDWGLARLLEGAEAGELEVDAGENSSDSIRSDRSDHGTETPGSPLLTETGQAIGTAMYSSPEQARGEREGVERASDVYSVGAMLYELLAGRAPYLGKGESPSAADVFARVRSGPPESLGRIAPDAPAELVAICERAMAREVAGRYPAVSELADELRAFLEGRVVGAYETGVWPEAKKWVLRNKGFAGALGAALAALLIGLATSLNLWFAEQERTAEVMLERDRLTRVVRFQKGIFERLDPNALGTRLRTAARDDLRSKLERSVSEDELEATVERFDDVAQLVSFTDVGIAAIGAEILDPAKGLASTEFEADPVSQATLMASIASAYERLGLIDAALALTRESLRLREESLGESDPQTLRSLGRLGTLLFDAGEYDEGLRCRQRALQLARRVLGPDHAETSDYIGDLALALGKTGDRDGALQMCEEALDANLRILGEDHRSTIVSMSNLGNALGNLGRNEEALSLMQRALDLSRRVLGDEDHNTLDIVSNVGFRLSRLGRYREALPYYEEALETRRRVLGSRHQDTLTSINNIGYLLLNLENYERAEAYLRENLEAARELFGLLHERTVLAKNGIGLFLYGRERFEEALTYFEEALDGAYRVLGPVDPHTLTITSNLASVLESLERYDESKAVYEGALESARRELGPDSLSALEIQSNLGFTLSATGDFAEAERVLSDALERCRRAHGPEHVQTLRITSNLSTPLTETGRFEEALELLEPAVERAWRTQSPEAYVSRALRQQLDSCYQSLQEAQPENGFEGRARELQNRLDALREERSEPADGR